MKTSANCWGGISRDEAITRAQSLPILLSDFSFSHWFDVMPDSDENLRQLLSATKI